MSYTSPDQILPTDQLIDAIRAYCAAANARLDDDTEWSDAHLSDLTEVVTQLRNFQREIRALDC